MCTFKSLFYNIVLLLTQAIQSDHFQLRFMSILFCLWQKFKSGSSSGSRHPQLNLSISLLNILHRAWFSGTNSCLPEWVMLLSSQHKLYRSSSVWPTLGGVFGLQGQIFLKRPQSDTLLPFHGVNICLTTNHFPGGVQELGESKGMLLPSSFHFFPWRLQIFYRVVWKVRLKETPCYQGFLGDRVRFACCCLKMHP